MLAVWLTTGLLAGATQGATNTATPTSNTALCGVGKLMGR